MTLDEAITHHTWAAQNSEGEVAEEHEQYAAWLWELRRLRKTWDTVHANTRALVLESEQLKSENASLRGAVMGLGELCDQLKAENEKLRELVRDMFMTFCTFRDTAMTDREELRHSVRFWKRLDELGIEVQ